VGGPATRITSADFVTPPEFAGLNLAANVAGRVGGLRLELMASPSGPRLAHCYQQIPMRVLPPFGFGPQQPALLFLLSPTAGLFDGDAHLMEITAGPGVHAVVAGQSATRIHPASAGFSTQQWKLRVADGAVLVVLPGPTIPFRCCRAYQRVIADLAPGAALVWADLWFAGRYARGAQSERFQFDRLIQEVEIRRNGQRVFRDRFAWQGPWDDETANWHLGGNLACGSVLVAGKLTDSVVSRLTEQGAALRTAAGDLCLRFSGPGELVTDAVVRAALTAGAALAGVETPWLPTGTLASCHWFSAVPIQ
jgi:urease accessory protein